MPPQQPTGGGWVVDDIPDAPGAAFDESAFRRWYADRAARLKLSADPDDPQHFFDYRAAFREGAEPDQSGHWPSKYKREGHPRLVIDGIDTRTGKPAGATSDEWDLADIPDADRRSGLAKAVDVVTTPLVPQIATRARELADRADIPRAEDADTDTAGGMLGTAWRLAKTFHDKGPLGFADTPEGRGLSAGVMEGAGTVLSQLTSPLDLVLTLAGLGSVQRAKNLGPVARLALQGGSAALAARGAERAIDADSTGDALSGTAQALMGAAGVATAFPKPTPQPRIAGRLTGQVRPSFVGTPEGTVATVDAIGMRKAPDGSFVKAVPAEYARHEIAGLLPPAAGFVADEAGRVVPRTQVGRLVVKGSPSQAPDPSFVRAEPAEYARRETRGLLPSGPRFVADDTGHVASLDRADELVGAALRPEVQTPQPTPAKRRVRGKGEDGSSEPVTVPAAVADFRESGQKIFSSDPQAQSVRAVPINDTQARGIRRIIAELENIEYTPRTRVSFEGAPRGRDEEWIAGSAGGRVYDYIRERHGRGNPMRAELLEAARKTLNGEPSTYGPTIRAVADDYEAGILRGELPPEAGDLPTSLRDADEDFQGFSDAVDDLSALGPTGEPGEAGRINPALLQHGGGAALGGVVGGTIGDTPEERLRNAVLGATAGALGVNGARRVTGRLVAKSPAAPIVGRFTVMGQQSGQPLPTTARRPGAPAESHADPMKGVDTFLEKFPEEFRGGIRDVIERNGGFDAQRRGVVDAEQVERLAQGVAVDVARTLKPGTALNAEAIRVHSAALIEAQKKVEDLAARIARGQNTDVDILALEAARGEVRVLAQSLMGARSEAGRALAQFRPLIRALETGNPKIIGEAAHLLRGEAAEFAATFAQQPNDPIARLRWLQQQDQPGKMERVRQYFISNILSGVKTHERNSIGNFANLVSDLAVHPTAAGMDAARSAITGAPRTVYLSELPSRVVGSWLGVERGLSEAFFSLRHGVNRSALTQSLSAAEVGKLDVPRVEFKGGGANPFNYPGRALDAADQFFRAIARNQEAYGLAHAQAKREGLTGPAFHDRMAELRAGVGDAGEKILEQADQYARRSVFQEKAGPIVGHLQAFTQKHPWFSFFMPFIRTPANILRQGAEFSPLGAAMPAARHGGRAGSQAQARVALGSIAAGGLAYLAATGRLSGSGPSDPIGRAQLMESGWRPNSVRLGDQWVEIALFQPISVQAMVIANAFEAWRGSGAKDADTATKAAATALKSIKSTLDLSFLSGVSDLFQALESRSLEGAAQYAGRLASGFVPFSGAQRTAAQAIDPTVRDPAGMVEQMMTGIPGVSNLVPARLNRFGQDVTRPGGALRRAADPFNVTPVNDDPVLAEIGRLGVRMGMPGGNISGADLSREQARGLQQLKGTTTHNVLQQIIQSEAYAWLSDERKAAVIERAIERARGRVQQGARRQQKARFVLQGAAR